MKVPYINCLKYNDWCGTILKEEKCNDLDKNEDKETNLKKCYKCEYHKTVWVEED